MCCARAAVTPRRGRHQFLDHRLLLCQAAARVQALPVHVPSAFRGVEHGLGKTSFEAAQRFGFGVSGGETFAVVVATGAIDANLGDRDAVQGCVQLPVPGSCHPDPPGGVTRPDRDRSPGSTIGPKRTRSPDNVPLSQTAKTRATRDGATLNCSWIQSRAHWMCWTWNVLRSNGLTKLSRLPPRTTSSVAHVVPFPVPPDST